MLVMPGVERWVEGGVLHLGLGRGRRGRRRRRRRRRKVKTLQCDILTL